MKTIKEEHEKLIELGMRMYSQMTGIPLIKIKEQYQAEQDITHSMERMFNE